MLKRKTWPQTPLGSGLLTGKYVGKRPDTGRLMENAMYQARYREDIYYEVAERFTGFAQKRGVHPVTLAVAWVAHHPAVTAPIIGARNLKQLEPALAAADFAMDDELYAAIAALSPTPPPATDRTDEQAGLAYRGSAERYR
ncbi:MAG: aldo/keto reductase [Candidatus Atribacteria bacterium]|nr:MAG: aldo/keto reductase [Candidatus Atribacteria bacterium]